MAGSADKDEDGKIRGNRSDKEGDADRIDMRAVRDSRK